MVVIRPFSIPMPSWQMEFNSLAAHDVPDKLHQTIPLKETYKSSVRANLQEHVHDRSQAVGSAGGIGHHVVVGLVILSVVHTANLSEESSHANSEKAIFAQC